MDMTLDMTMSSIRPNRVEVVTSVQRRRRWTPEQKLEIVKQTNEPGSSVSLVARQHGLTAAQLFQWRKAYLEGSLVAVGANETVVPASELQEAMRRIKQLEGALGRKTLRKLPQIENNMKIEASTSLISLQYIRYLSTSVPTFTY